VDRGKTGQTGGLRLAVKGRMLGLQYRYGLAESVEADDTVVETDGVKLVVDSVSLDLVAGCVVDYVESLGGAAFKVENLNAVAGCGWVVVCGLIVKEERCPAGKLVPWQSP
jgi:iron-sulfur cluster assembly accessory protein